MLIPSLPVIKSQVYIPFLRQFKNLPYLPLKAFWCTIVLTVVSSFISCYFSFLWHICDFLHTWEGTPSKCRSHQKIHVPVHTKPFVHWVYLVCCASHIVFYCTGDLYIGDAYIFWHWSKTHWKHSWDCWDFVGIELCYVHYSPIKAASS